MQKIKLSDKWLGLSPERASLMSHLRELETKKSSISNEINKLSALKKEFDEVSLLIAVVQRHLDANKQAVEPVSQPVMPSAVEPAVITLGPESNGNSAVDANGKHLCAGAILRNFILKALRSTRSAMTIKQIKAKIREMGYRAHAPGGTPTVSQFANAIFILRHKDSSIRCVGPKKYALVK